MKKIIFAFLALTLVFSSVGVAYAENLEFKIGRSLFRGVSGSDVSELQEILAADSELYPEGLVTGFFGALTEKAVKRFQKKHGIEQVGIMGPKTKAKIMSWLNDSAGATSTIRIAPGLLKKIGTSTQNIFGTSTRGYGENKITLCHVPRGNPSAKYTIVIGAPGAVAHIAHGDTLGACGTGTTTPTTTPQDVTAPVISNVLATSTASTTATITWTTNELSSSGVWYGTTSPVTIASSTNSVSNSSLVTSHSLSLSGLLASTTYYFMTASTDAASNIATSSTSSFVTLP